MVKKKNHPYFPYWKLFDYKYFISELSVLQTYMPFASLLHRIGYDNFFSYIQNQKNGLMMVQFQIIYFISCTYETVEMFFKNHLQMFGIIALRVNTRQS